MDILHFGPRDVPRWGQHASAASLVVGATYFRVAYFDRDLHNPFMEPLIFIGRNLGEGDSGMFYFQTLESHMDGVRFGSPDHEAGDFHRVSEGTPFVYEYERALDELLRCSRRRAEDEAARNGS